MTPEQIKILKMLQDARHEIEIYSFDPSISMSDRETCDALSGMLTTALRTFGHMIKK